MTAQFDLIRSREFRLACAADAIRVITPSSLTSSPASVPTTAPSRRTTILSEPSTTSSSSDEIRITAMPWAARSLISAWISAFAPTSMPRVGSSRSRTRGSRQRTRARRTFCWLPPESSLTRWSGSGRLDPQPVHQSLDDGVLAPIGHEAGPGQRGQGGQDDVVAHRQRRHDPLGLAVLGEKGDSGGDRCARGPTPDRRPGDRDRPVVERAGPHRSPWRSRSGPSRGGRRARRPRRPEPRRRRRSRRWRRVRSRRPKHGFGVSCRCRVR